MNRSTFIKSTLLAVCCLSFASAMACTDVTLQAKDGTVVNARTMEFAYDLKSDIISAPRGTAYKNTAQNGKASMSWTNKYGYLYLNGFNLPFATDGMNEKGLSFSALYLPGYTQYQALPKNPNHAIPYFQFGDWVLGNFSNVDQVKTALKNLKVFSQDLNVPQHPNAVFPIHEIVTDATGKSIVIEFVKGKMMVHDDPLGILTNGPTFDWHLNNLKNYVNLTPYSPKPTTVNGFVYAATGQGSGMFGLPGSSTPPARFVKMAFLSKTAVPVDNADQLVKLANGIIGTVFIPKGFVRPEKSDTATPYETTQWTVIKDLKHKVLYFKSYDYPVLQSINLSKVDFSKGAKSFKLPVENPQPVAHDVTGQFLK